MLRNGICDLYDIILLNIMYSILYSFQEPTLPVHLQRTWQLNSSQVGLVFFSAALPAMLG
jgi:DHA1 family solute carrier family 18 vesicular amine transporter 1/2